MDLKTEMIDEQKVKLELKGEIDFGNSDLISDKIFQLIEHNYSKFVIDFDQVESIDSSGIGKFLMLNKKLNGIDGELIFSNVNSEYLKKIFKTISLDEIIEFE